jgi:hypothetical protein
MALTCINRRRLLSLVLSAACVLLGAQPTVDVAEVTVRLKGYKERIYYYGFAAGDQVLLSFEENHEKTLDVLEFGGEAGNVIYAEADVQKIRNKSLTIPSTGIYKVRIRNGSLFNSRTCWLKIQRVPGSENTRNFNTTVYTRIVYDTTYTEEKENIVVQSDTIVSHILQQTLKVHSMANLTQANRILVPFQLPAHTVSWAYYIGVDWQGRQAYSDATTALASQGSPAVRRLANNDPTAALALGFPALFSGPVSGEDIKYRLMVDGTSSPQKAASVTCDFSKMEMAAGKCEFHFENDNLVTPVEVFLQVVAVHLKTSYDYRLVRKPRVKSRKEMYLRN